MSGKWEEGENQGDTKIVSKLFETTNQKYSLTPRHQTLGFILS